MSLAFLHALVLNTCFVILMDESPPQTSFLDVFLLKIKPQTKVARIIYFLFLSQNFFHFSYKDRKSNTESKILRFGGTKVLLCFFLFFTWLIASVYRPVIVFFCLKDFFEIHSKNLITSYLLTSSAISFINSKKLKQKSYLEQLTGTQLCIMFNMGIVQLEKMSKKLKRISAQEKICKLVRLAVLLFVRQQEINWLLKQIVLWLEKLN